MFITFEGGEGAGKTTQAKLLVGRLQAQGYEAAFTREPGGTPIATCIRALLLHPDETLEALTTAGLVDASEHAERLLPLTEVLLLSAARAQHVARMRRWLQEGRIVVCDRFTDATYAYQGAGRGVNVDIIVRAEELATGGLKPDLTFLFDLPVYEGHQRKKRAIRRSLPQQLDLFVEGEDGREGIQSGSQSQDGRPPSEDVEMNRLDREALAFYERVRQGYLMRLQDEPNRIVKIDAGRDRRAVANAIWRIVSARLHNTDNLRSDEPFASPGTRSTCES